MILNYQKYGKDLVITLLFGTVIGMALYKAETMAFKWMMFMFIICCGMSFFFASPKRENLLLLAFFFFLPMFAVNFHPIYLRNNGFAWPVSGIVIFLYDIPFLLLFIFWLYRIINSMEEHIHFFPWISFPFLIIIILAIAGKSRNALPEIIFLSALGLVIKSWLVFLFIANNLKKKNLVLLVTVAIILTLVHPSVIGLLQYIKGGTLGLKFLGEAEEISQVTMGSVNQAFRITGTFGSPNVFAAFLHMRIPIVMALLFAPINNIYKLILTALLALSSLILLLTYSRGGWAGCSLGSIIEGYWCLVRKNGRKIISLGIVLIIASVSGLLTITFVKSVRDRLFEDDHHSSEVRVYLKINSYNMIRHHPLLGVGLGNYAEIARFYDNTGWYTVATKFRWPVHNEYLLIATELGLPALCIFIFLLSVIFVMLFRIGCSHADPIMPYIAIGFFGSLAAWCYHHQHDFDWIIMKAYMWANIGVIQAMYYITENRRHNIKN